MRICFIALGTFTHIGPYLDFFKEAGHDVHFVALTPGPARNVPTYNADCLSPRNGKVWKGWYLLAMLKARKLVRKLNPDIVHAHYATSAGLAAWVCGVKPYLVTAHGTDVTLGRQGVVWRQLLWWIFKNAARVNPVSDELREMILNLGIPAEKIETLTLGIDTQQFAFRKHRPTAKGGGLRLICTRRFEKVYDHETIIKAMSILAGRQIEFKLTLVGDGPLRKPLQVLALLQGVGDKITFTGQVPNAQLPELLANHDVYLSASERDGASLSLLEAMASGIYPIVSDIRANSDWIENGRNGRLHTVADPQSLADCVLSHLRDPSSIHEVLANNRQLVLLKGDRATNMKRLEAVYWKLMANATAANTVNRPSFSAS